MNLIANLLFIAFSSVPNFAPDVNIGLETFMPVNPPIFMIVGIGLIIVTLFILFFLKKFIMNSIFGGIIWAIAVLVLKINLPIIPSLVVSIIIGPAGIGTMLLLNAFGLI